MDKIYRRLYENDSPEQIAKLIYLTDLYIYESLFSSFDDKLWIEIIKEEINDKNSIFYKDNLYVCDVDGVVAGLLCACDNGKEYTFAPEHNNLDFTLVKEKYFIPLFEDIKSLTGSTFVHLCVDTNYRKQGIGRSLFEYYFNNISSNDITLDVLDENKNAIKMYESLGFESNNSYYGFGGKEKEDLLVVNMHKK